MHFVQEIFSFFLKQLFTGYAEDRQTRLRFLINVTAYLRWKTPVFQSNGHKLVTQRLTLFKTALTSTFHVSHDRTQNPKWKSQQLMPSKSDALFRGR